MRIRILDFEAGREIAVGTLQLHRGHRSGAVERIQARARGVCDGAPSLTAGVGEQLLLVDIHLALDL